MKQTVLRAALLALTLLTTVAILPSRAGVVNPDISLIGQPAIRWSDDAADPARKRPTLALGETELVFDAALNPYARGTAVFSIYRRPGNSVAFAEVSLAFLHITAQREPSRAFSIGA